AFSLAPRCAESNAGRRVLPFDLIALFWRYEGEAVHLRVAPAGIRTGRAGSARNIAHEPFFRPKFSERTWGSVARVAEHCDCHQCVGREPAEPGGMVTGGRGFL